ncbi:unnamed protein product, partial [Cladocopium goreaui]
VCISAAITACEKSAQWTSAAELLAALRMLRSAAPNSTSCNAVLSACEKGFQWLQAVNIFRQIHSSLRCSETTLNAMASACEKCSQWQMALRNLPMDGSGQEKHLMGFNAAMCACHKGGCSWRSVLQLFASGPAPSNVSYDATLLATAAAGAGAGAWRHGLQLLWQMQHDSGCTAFSYELLMNALTSGRDTLVTAQSLLAEATWSTGVAVLRSFCVLASTLASTSPYTTLVALRLLERSLTPRRARIRLCLTSARAKSSKVPRWVGKLRTCGRACWEAAIPTMRQGEVWTWQGSGGVEDYRNCLAP